MGGGGRGGVGGCGWVGGEGGVVGVGGGRAVRCVCYSDAATTGIDTLSLTTRFRSTLFFPIVVRWEKKSVPPTLFFPIIERKII